MDSPGIPLGWLLLVIIGLPACVAAFFGLLAFKDMTPLVFRCQRCSRDFTRRAWRRFPRSCPRCRARDWNAQKH